MIDKFVEKETRIRKAQPFKFSTESFSKGFKVNVEINFNPYDSLDMDQLMANDSLLETALKKYIQMIERVTGDKLIRNT